MEAIKACGECVYVAKNGIVLREAFNLINGERQAHYGPPAENFAHIAQLWSVFLGYKISAKQVCLMMALLKLAREAHATKPDNLIDAAGYVGLAADMKGCGNDRNND